MAKMIPARISDSVISNAERKIFALFENDPATENWIVLHSLGLTEHDTVIFGEVDFVVIAPGLGIFCLEIKGGRVSRQDGVWAFTNRFGTVSIKKRSPFDQAREGMFSLQKAVKKRFANDSHICRLIYGYGVMFPDIEFDVSSTEHEKWQIYDLTSSGQPVSRYIKRLSDNTIWKWESLYGHLGQEMLPTRKDALDVGGFLRCDFERAIPLCQQIGTAESNLIKLTQEQFRCIDQYEDNKRCLVKGPAGTGKTLIAIETARRAIKKGERAALFCYNAKLGEWLKTQFSNEELATLHVGTFHSFLTATAKKHGMNYFPQNDDNGNFFEADLPLAVAGLLNNEEPLFDRVIIDEAQDLVAENYLLAIDAMLKNGLERGCWNFFGDFEQQAIFSSARTGLDIIDALESFAGFATVKLTVNCRNTKNIGQEILLVTDLKSRYLPTAVDGPKVVYKQFATEEEQAGMLAVLFDELKAKGIKKEQIVILSPVQLASSVVSKEGLRKFDIRDTDESGRYAFSTIQAFKGLESTVIILVDITTYNRKNLMYVALSRARTALYVFENANAKSERMVLFRGLLQ